MNWVFEYQGEDLIKHNNGYYAWDEAQSQYILLDSEDFKDSYSGSDIYVPEGEYWDREDEFEVLPHLEDYVPTVGGEEGAIGEVEDFGMEGLTAESFLGMDVDEAVDYIKAVKYAGDPPKEATDAKLRTVLERFLPKMGEIDQEKMKFLAEEYGGTYAEKGAGWGKEFDLNNDGMISEDESKAMGGSAWDDADRSFPKVWPSEGIEVGADPTRTISFAESLSGRKAGLEKDQSMYGLQAEAYKQGAQTRGIYGGSGASTRAGMFGATGISKGFDIAQDTYGLTKDAADITQRKAVYGLEKERQEEWESNFEQFLGSLPSPSV